MRFLTISLLVMLLAGCSVALPKKPSAGSVWHLRPAVEPVTDDRKPFSIVVAKPWLTTGYDSRRVMVSIADGEIDGLADVAWAANHGDWLRNYFIEGLQSSQEFSAVTGNQSIRGNLVFLRLYVWDLSVHYEDAASRSGAQVRAKFAVSVTNGRGDRLVQQQIIESRKSVNENRLTAIMQGFDAVVADCYEQIRALLRGL